MAHQEDKIEIEYIVVAKNNYNDFIKEVKSLINSGWELVGGVSMKEDLLLQALIKKFNIG